MKPTGEHTHDYNTPKARLANPERGLFFLLWACSCGREKASNLLSREGIEEIRKQYLKRVADKAHLDGDPISVGKGESGRNTSDLSPGRKGSLQQDL